MDKGQLVYEYNMMIIERYIARSKRSSRPASTRSKWIPRSQSPARRRTSCSRWMARRSLEPTVKRTVPAAFTASETFDVGVDLGSPVSLDYFDRRPFAFDGKINSVTVDLK